MAAPPVDILVVDDHPQSLVALRSVLECDDYNVVTATSGTEALKRVLEHDFAVILLDVFMPQMDGYDVAKVIKQRARSRHTPIIFLTAAGADVGLVYRGYSVGAVDCLSKPIDADVLRAKIDTFAALFRKDLRIQEQAAALREADRRARERELAELRISSQQRYRNLAEAIPQIVWTSDSTGGLTYVSRRWADYTGQGFDQARAWGWLDAVHPLDARRYTDAWERATATSEVLELEVRLRRADGVYRWHLSRAVPEQAAHGATIGWLGTHTDIDDRRRASDLAEEAVRARDEFLSIASHELRTPLTTLNLRLEGMASQIARDDHTGFARKIESARRQGARLMSLVDSLLDVSRITTGHLTLQREAFDLADAAREVVDGFSEDAARARCPLALEVRSRAVGCWDRMRIEQILQNLLANAIKYAPDAPIEVTVDAADRRGVVAVCDRGQGVSEADVERIFARFERAVPMIKYGGLGLGLFVAKQIAEAHGGAISVAPTPGGGATFRVELPLQQP